MKKIAVFVAALAMVGCTKTVEEMGYKERNELAKVIAKRCADQGIADGHPQSHACITAEVQSEVAKRRIARAREERTRMALAAGMQGMGDAYSSNAAVYSQPTNRTVRCTTTPRSTFVGATPTSYQTSCY